MKAVIFDMDGTLADVEHRIPFLIDGHPDYDGFNSQMNKDTPHLHICDLARHYFSCGYTILICTARDPAYRAETKKQLDDWDVPATKIYMRKVKDKRSDVSVKREMLDLMFNDGYEPTMAFDDRDHICKMWREEGIICFQVAEGAY